MRILRGLGVVLFVCFLSVGLVAQTTDFSYQGNLTNAGSPANGQFDFEFALFESALGGPQVGSTLNRTGITATNGVFSVNLDFGVSFPGADRWLEIRVRTSGGGAFSTLAPRQRVASSPYAIKSLTADIASNATNAANAATATNATNATNAATATNFTGTLVGDVAGTQGATTVARLRGTNVSTTAPANGQVLKFNSTSGQWQPATDETSTGGGGGTITGVTAGTGLNGGGSSGNVALSIANGGVDTPQLATGAVTAVKISNGVAVRSLNSLTENVTLAAGSNMSITPTLNTLTISSTAPNAIFNQTTPQGGANFNIVGNGTVSGTLTGNTVTALTQFNLGSERALSFAGTENAFGGRSAGIGNTTGSANTFFGNIAGFTNTTGNANSFFGRSSGLLNTTGSTNSFFGRSAGFDNTTGSENSFFGANAGSNTTTGNSNTFVGTIVGGTNITGSKNTLLGDRSDVGSGNLTFATAIGAETQVSTSNTIVLGRSAGLDTVRIPGDLNVTGTFTGSISGASITNLNASNITTGTLSNSRLGIVPVGNGGTGSATQNFVDLTTAQTIGGNKTFSGTLSGNVVNATTQYNIGGNRILSNLGTNNLFAGAGAGSSVTTGSNNAFFGQNAGSANTTGDRNTFFGQSAGSANTTGDSNTFFGRYAGILNTTGSINVFFGQEAGVANTSGNLNAFVGSSAGIGNTTGDYNAYFGTLSGLSNTIGNDNTLIGSQADVGAPNLNNATAIGAKALVTQDNSVVIGSINGVNNATATTSVGINTTAPKARLHVVGNIYIENNPNSLIIQSPNGSCFKITVSNAGVLSANAQACP